MPVSLLAGLLPAAAPLMLLLALTAAGFAVVVPADIRIGGADPIRRGELDFELVQLIPLGICAIPLGNSPQILEATLGRYGFWRWWS